MKIFYFCQTGVHTALIAANIHLGFLPTDIPLTADRLRQIEGYASLTKEQIGKIIFIGKDSSENEIYSFGVLNEDELGPKAIINLLKLYNIKSSEYKFVDLNGCSHGLLKLGLLIEFVFKKNLISNYFFVFGLRKNYEKIVKKVIEAKN